MTMLTLKECLEHTAKPMSGTLRYGNVWLIIDDDGNEIASSTDLKSATYCKWSIQRDRGIHADLIQADVMQMRLL